MLGTSLIIDFAGGLKKENVILVSREEHSCVVPEMYTFTKNVSIRYESNRERS